MGMTCPFCQFLELEKTRLRADAEREGFGS